MVKMEVELTGTVQGEIEVDPFNILMDTYDNKDLIEFVKKIDGSIATWEFSLSLLKILIEEDLKLLPELGSYQIECVEDVYPQLKKLTKKFKQYLKACKEME